MYGQQVTRNKSMDVLFNANQQLESLLRLFKQISKHSSSSSKQQLVELTKLLEFSFQRYLSTNKNHLLNLMVQLKHSYRFNVTSHFHVLNQNQEKLKNSTINLLISNKRNLTELEKNRDLLDPIHVMKRGFSITRLNGNAITSHEEIKNFDEIETQLVEGSIRSVVKK
jgi:exodeoxyribonuclease VII large subunit